MAEDKKESKTAYSLIEVPTQTQVMFKNNSTGENLDLMGMILDLANKVAKLEKSI